MQLKQRLKLMPMLSPHLLILTGALLFTSCSVAIKDESFYALIPGYNGAVADNFLTQNQRILTEADWQKEQAAWNAEGQVTECMSSNALGDFKTEIEQLCSVSSCTYETQAAIKGLLVKLQRAQKKALSLGIRRPPGGD